MPAVPTAISPAAASAMILPMNVVFVMVSVHRGECGKSR